MWIKVEDRLPDPWERVLAWDEKRGFSIGYWIKREDLPDGRMWSINRSSGGIDTPIEVYPPEYWRLLPLKPGVVAPLKHTCPTCSCFAG